MTTRQIAVRLPGGLLADVDELISAGVFESRADAVRSALEAIVDAERRRRVGAVIVEGYRRLPPDAEFDAWAAGSAEEMIGEEPG